jgi:hypothetical protein
LLAVKVMLYVPTVPDAGVPLSTPVKESKLTPLGSVPVLLKAGLGKPVAVTVNVPPVPNVNDVLFALVIAGAWSTVSVKLCVAAVPTPLLAVIVKA